MSDLCADILFECMHFLVKGNGFGVHNSFQSYEKGILIRKMLS